MGFPALSSEVSGAEPVRDRILARWTMGLIQSGNSCPYKLIRSVSLHTTKGNSLSQDISSVSEFGQAFAVNAYS